VTNRARQGRGRAGQGGQGKHPPTGPTRYISLGKTGGLASNQTKIQFF